MTQNIIENALTNSSSGATETFVLKNDSNTASSQAECAIVQGGSTGDDAYTQYKISTTRSHTIGIDESDTNAFLISTGTGGSVTPSSGTTHFKIDETNTCTTKPLQPCFLAYKSADSTNVTGDGTAYTVIFNTERFDIGSNYNTTTGVFTAPVTGKYLIGCQVGSSNMTAAMTYINARIIASSGNKVGQKLHDNAVTQNGINAWAIINMDASDTAQVDFFIFNGTKTATVNGNTSTTTYFYGVLIS